MNDWLQQQKNCKIVLCMRKATQARKQLGRNETDNIR